jgi:hypothetical protein
VGFTCRFLSDNLCLHKALERLVRLYDAWGQKDPAGRWRKQYHAEQPARSKAALRKGTQQPERRFRIP